MTVVTVYVQVESKWMTLWSHLALQRACGIAISLCKAKWVLNFIVVCVVWCQRQAGTTAKQKPMCPLEIDEIDTCSHQITAQDTWNKYFGKRWTNIQKILMLLHPARLAWTLPTSYFCQNWNLKWLIGFSFKIKSVNCIWSSESGLACLQAQALN